MPRIILPTLIVVLILAVVAPAPAATIFDSGPPLSGSGPISVSISGDVVAGTFTLSDTATIQSIDLITYDQVGVNPDITWGIYGNNAGQVGRQINTGTVVSTFLPTSPPGGFAIDGTRYIRDSGGFSIPATTLPPGNYFFAVTDASDSSMERTWAVAAASPTSYLAEQIGGTWTTFPAFAVSFQLLDTPFPLPPGQAPGTVPAPGSLVMWLVSGGWLAVGMVRQRG